MITRTLPALLGVLGFCLTSLAQEMPDPFGPAEIITPEELRITGELDVAPALDLYRADLFRTTDGSVLIHGLPTLTLLNGRRFSSALSRMGMAPLDIFPMAFLTAVEVQTGSSPRYGSDGPGGVINLRTNPMRNGGEVGLFYGKSGGKYGREDLGAHIIGTVGNDKFQITAGATYQESEGRNLRSGR